MKEAAEAKKAAEAEAEKEIVNKNGNVSEIEVKQHTLSSREQIPRQCSQAIGIGRVKGEVVEGGCCYLSTPHYFIPS